MLKQMWTKYIISTIIDKWYPENQIVTGKPIISKNIVILFEWKILFCSWVSVWDFQKEFWPGGYQGIEAGIDIYPSLFYSQAGPKIYFYQLILWRIYPSIFINPKKYSGYKFYYASYHQFGLYLF